MERLNRGKEISQPNAAIFLALEALGFGVNIASE